MRIGLLKALAIPFPMVHTPPSAKKQNKFSYMPPQAKWIPDFDIFMHALLAKMSSIGLLEPYFVQNGQKSGKKNNNNKTKNTQIRPLTPIGLGRALYSIYIYIYRQTPDQPPWATAMLCYRYSVQLFYVHIHMWFSKHNYS